MAKAPAAKKTPAKPRGKKRIDELPLDDAAQVETGPPSDEATAFPEGNGGGESGTPFAEDGRHGPMFPQEREESRPESELRDGPSDYREPEPAHAPETAAEMASQPEESRGEQPTARQEPSERPGGPGPGGGRPQRQDRGPRPDRQNRPDRGNRGNHQPQHGRHHDNNRSRPDRDRGNRNDRRIDDRYAPEDRREPET